MALHWILIIAAIVFIIQAYIYKRWSLSKVNYTRYFSTDAIFQGEHAEMIEIVQNNKWLPLPWLRVESLVHAELLFRTGDNFDVSSGKIYQNHKSLFSLMPYTQIRRRHQLTGSKRGYYRLNTASLTSGDILGFQQVYNEVQLASEMLVYPQILSIDEVPLPAHSFMGDITVRRWIMEDPFMIAGTRQYESGDSLRYINWKATSRTGELQVHQHDYTANHHLMIYVNFEVTEKMWGAVTNEPLIEQAISFAASIAHYAVQQGIETGFGCNGKLFGANELTVRLAPANGRSHLYAIYDCMARLQLERAFDFHSFMEDDLQAGIRQTDFLIITPYISERMELLSRQLEQAGNAVRIWKLDTINRKEESA